MNVFEIKLQAHQSVFVLYFLVTDENSHLNKTETTISFKKGVNY